MSSGEAKTRSEAAAGRGKRFTRLVRHSIERVMNGGDESGELDFGIGAMLALLAAPGAFASVAASLSRRIFFYRAGDGRGRRSGDLEMGRAHSRPARLCEPCAAPDSGEAHPVRESRSSCCF